jgi:hypothetical protein
MIIFIIVILIKAFLLKKHFKGFFYRTPIKRIYDITRHDVILKFSRSNIFNFGIHRKNIIMIHSIRHYDSFYSRQ